MTDKILRSDIALGAPLPRLNRALRLGVVGGGRIAHIQAMAARQTGSWEVVAGAFSSNADKAKQQASEWRIDPARAYANFEEMAMHEATHADGIDAVMITTPNHIHHPAAKSFMQQGIAVICDKPLTNTWEEANDLLQLQHKHDVLFGVCYVMSCFPMVRQAREIVAAGTLGALNQIHVEFMQDWMLAEDIADAAHIKWRLDPHKSGKTSCVGDIGTHAVHLAAFVSGRALTDLRAEFHVCGAPKPLEDTAFMLTRYGGEIPGTLMATRLAAGNRGGLRLRIFGDKGGLEWNLEDSERLKLNIFGQADQIISRGHGAGVSSAVETLIRTGRGFPEGFIEAWANLYGEFAIAIAAKIDQTTIPEGYLAYPQLAEGVAGVGFIDAAFESAQSGGAWVHIAPVNV